MRPGKILRVRFVRACTESTGLAPIDVNTSRPFRGVILSALLECIQPTSLHVFDIGERNTLELARVFWFRPPAAHVSVPESALLVAISLDSGGTVVISPIQ